MNPTCFGTSKPLSGAKIRYSKKISIYTCRVLKINIREISQIFTDFYDVLAFIYDVIKNLLCLMVIYIYILIYINIYTY